MKNTGTNALRKKWWYYLLKCWCVLSISPQWYVRDFYYRKILKNELLQAEGFKRIRGRRKLDLGWGKVWTLKYFYASTDDTSLNRVEWQKRLHLMLDSWETWWQWILRPLIESKGNMRFFPTLNSWGKWWWLLLDSFMHRYKK